MEEYGTVIEVVTNDVKVSMIKTEACAQCRACISGMMEKEMIIVAKNDCDARVGDKVVIALNESSFLTAVLIMYGIPLVMLLAGFFLTDIIMQNNGGQNNELLSFLIGLCPMICSYLIIFKNNHMFKNKKYEPIATAILNGKNNDFI